MLGRDPRGLELRVSVNVFPNRGLRSYKGYSVLCLPLWAEATREPGSGRKPAET